MQVVQITLVHINLDKFGKMIRHHYMNRDLENRFLRDLCKFKIYLHPVRQVRK